MEDYFFAKKADGGGAQNVPAGARTGGSGILPFSLPLF